MINVVFVIFLLCVKGACKKCKKICSQFIMNCVCMATFHLHGSPERNQTLFLGISHRFLSSNSRFSESQIIALESVAYSKPNT